MTPDNNGYLLPDDVDDFWVDAIGVGRDDWEDSTHAPFAKGYIDLARRIIKRSDIATLVDGWIEEDRAGKRGGGPSQVFVESEAALTVLLMHAIATGFAPSYKQMANTLSRRMSAKKAAKLGVVFQPKVNWYFRIYRPLRKILKAIDPDYFPEYLTTARGGPPVHERLNRHRRLTPEEYAEVVAHRDPTRQAILRERADTFMNLLVQTSVKLAGKHV
jgi:hypothetical protein